MSNIMSKLKKNDNKIANYSIAINNIKKQNNMCGICKDKLLDINNDEILCNEELINTNCNHVFHLECLEESYIHNLKKYYQSYKIRECPYCRSETGYIPLIHKNPIKFIHKEYNVEEKIKCTAIIKSGKNKGNICGCNIKNINNGNKYCGKHKNYKPPIENKQNTEDDDWYKNKILKTY